MILLKRNKINEWLVLTNHNQNWLCQNLRLGKPYTKGYVSHLMHNRARISRAAIDGFMRITQMRFEDLFYIDDEKDTREFYGNQAFMHGRLIDWDEYDLEIDRILQKKT